MACKAAALICLALLSGCVPKDGANQKRLSAASAAGAVTASLSQSLPTRLDSSCTAHVPDVEPKATEPWVTTASRWRVVRENRNDEADACAEWWRDYRARVGFARPNRR
ncbi:hypothetical protein [Rhizobium sp. SGZ-381]|uniref:hypothetical protein n=1 Tax=Rhizobium sp. SGZ-381 TaxID=3342800 RepID=UPI00366B0C6A